MSSKQKNQAENERNKTQESRKRQGKVIASVLSIFNNNRNSASGRRTETEAAAAGATAQGTEAAAGGTEAAAAGATGEGTTAAAATEK